MNGGFAMKLAASPEDVIAALGAAGRAEGIVLGPVTAGAVNLGIALRGDETIVKLEDDRSDVLEGIATALAEHLAVAACVVVDSDEGAEILRAWHGGEGLEPTAGWNAWDAGACFGLIVPAPIARADVTLSSEIDRAQYAAVAALGAHTIGVWRRSPAGPIARALDEWRVSIGIPGSEPVTVELSSPLKKLGKQVASLVADALDSRPELANQRRVIDRGSVPVVGLESLECSGFATLCYHARVAIDGEISELAWVGSLDDIHAEIVDERAARADAQREALDDVLTAQLRRGELAAAADTYRELHADYFASRPLDHAIAEATEKIAALAKLYR